VKEALEAAMLRELENKMKTILNTDAQKCCCIWMGHMAYDSKLNKEVVFLLSRSISPIVFLDCNEASTWKNSFEHFCISTLPHNILCQQWHRGCYDASTKQKIPSYGNMVAKFSSDSLTTLEIPPITLSSWQV
jgi:hypothetical protein